MDKIMLLILFSIIIGSVTKGSNAQLECYVCNDCPNANELDANLVQTCGAPDDLPDITTPDQGDTTTTTQTPDTTTETTTDNPIITQTTPIQPPTTTTQVPEDTTTQTSDGEITTLTPPVTPPSTTPQIPISPPDILGYKYRHFVRQLIGTYQCFVVHQQVGDSTQVNRGCVLTQQTVEQTCSNANSGVEPEFCRLCATDQCNTASKYAASLVITLFGLFLARFTVIR